MIKTKDTIVAGLLAGWIGNIFKEALTWSFHLMGWVRYTFVHIAAGFYYSAENIDAPLSLVNGAITDWTIAGAFGVILLLLLRKTGTDYAIVKGIGLGAIVYIAAFGIGMALDITRATLLTPLPDFLLLQSHLVFGGITGWAVRKYFGQAVFREQSNTEKEPLKEKEVKAVPVLLKSQKQEVQVVKNFKLPRKILPKEK